MKILSINSDYENSPFIKEDGKKLLVANKCDMSLTDNLNVETEISINCNNYVVESDYIDKKYDFILVDENNREIEGLYESDMEQEYIKVHKNKFAVEDNKLKISNDETLKEEVYTIAEGLDISDSCKIEGIYVYEGFVCRIVTQGQKIVRNMLAGVIIFLMLICLLLSVKIKFVAFILIAVLGTMLYKTLKK